LQCSAKPLPTLLHTDLVSFRHAPSPKAQLQLFVKTRFSSMCLLIESLLKYKEVLLAAVNCVEYAKASAKAQRRKLQGPSYEESPEALREHEEELETLETGLYNTKAPPVALRGLQKYAVVFLDVTSLRFWAALQVRGSDMKFCH
jgi:hypothetical protein